MGVLCIVAGISENKHRTYEVKLWQDYQDEKAAHESAMAEWRQSEDALSTLTKLYEGTVTQLQNEVLRLKNLPPEIEYKYVEVKVPVNVNVPVYTKPQYFSNLNELSTWVNNWTLNIEGGVFDIKGFDCDDYSIHMVTDAALDGYIIGFVIDTARKHMLVAAIIGNDIYFIEPQTKAIAPTLDGVYWVVEK